MKNIIIATDTFEQVNGVSTTYKNILKVRTITNYEVSQLVLSVR